MEDKKTDTRSGPNEVWARDKVPLASSCRHIPPWTSTYQVVLFVRSSWWLLSSWQNISFRRSGTEGQGQKIEGTEDFARSHDKLWQACYADDNRLQRIRPLVSCLRSALCPLQSHFLGHLATLQAVRRTKGRPPPSWTKECVSP